MYSNFDFQELERATQESLARIYKESMDSQEYVDEAKCNETYNKIRKILDCPEMEKCHPYLYSLDMENVNESDTEKVNRIYQLGLDRGMYQDDIEKNDAEDACDGCEDGECDCEEPLCGGPKDSLTGQEMTPQEPPAPRKPIYTVMYSAQKNGCGAMGEFYSMAPTIEGAKEDCINQMGANGYQDVMVMAVDQTYPGVDDEYMDDYASQNYPVVPSDGGTETVQEDDSEEFLKQETGDDSKPEDEKIEEETKTEEPTIEDEKSEEEPKEKENTEEKTEDTEDKKEDETKEDSEKAEEENSKEDTKQEEPKEEEKPEDTENTETENTTEDDTKEEETTDEESKEDEEKKLTAEEKTAMQTLYTKTFKDVLKKIGNEKSVSEMTLQERTDFYEKLSEKWDKNDPSDFMSDKDQEKLNKIVVKPDAK